MFITLTPSLRTNSSWKPKNDPWRSSNITHLQLIEKVSMNKMKYTFLFIGFKNISLSIKVKKIVGNIT